MEAIPSSDEDKEVIKKALVIPHREVFQKLLDRVKRVVVLDEHGNAHVVVPREKLTDSQQLALLLLARWFAYKAGMAQAETMTAEELARATGVPYKTVTARIAGLKRQGRVDADERGAYRIRYVAIEEILNEIEARIGEEVPS